MNQPNPLIPPSSPGQFFAAANPNSPSNPVYVSGTLSADYLVEIARGYVSGASYVDKFGRNDDVDTAAEEDVWAAGATRARLTAAETMDVESDSANDDDGGTGARTVTIEGLDGDYMEVSETITMNGTSAVTTTQTFLRINRAYVVTAGSAESNVGAITIDPTTTGSGSRQGYIAAGDGQTLLSHYTVPAGKTAYMVSSQVSCHASPGTTGVKEAIMKLWKAHENQAWRIQKSVGSRSDGTSISGNLSSGAPESFAAKTDLKWTADVDNNNTAVYVQYSLLLFDD